jgi:hypothetical protein
MFTFLVLLLFITSVVSQTCHPFQTYDTPRISPLQKYCTMYQNYTCCDNGTAKRAYNWAYEDDGCGIVYNDCLRLSIDVACFLNCSPNMTSVKVETFTGIVHRPLVDQYWLEKIYTACLPYAWCGTSQLLTSTCVFLQKIQQYRSSDAVTTVNRKDTCTFVSDLTMEEFAENILYVAIDYNNTIPIPAHEISLGITLTSGNILMIILILFQLVMFYVLLY